MNRWIWPFELLEKIGVGGMGEVYRARFVKNDREVAVKLLPEDVANETILARFEREMEILKSLRHPNIVHCFGGTCEGDQRFYAMELVPGGTLAGRLRKHGRFSPDAAIDYGLQACSALAYAHARGIVHRDIKPGNFLLTAEGKLKLSDFGLSTIVAGRRLTADDRTVGTFLYMAPEQIAGKPPVSEQTDLYALGCVLFELVAGRPPFLGETSAEVLHQHMTQPPPLLSEFSLTCPPALDRLLARLLEKRPEDRPQDAEQVARELKRIQNSVTVIDRGAGNTAAPGKAPPPSSGPAGERERTATFPQAWMGWVVALAAVALLAMMWWNRSLARRAAGFDRAETLWIEAYQNSDGLGERQAAARALGRLGQHSQRSVDALTEGLETEDFRVRAATVEALGEAGANAKSALTLLIKLKKTDDRSQVRLAAAESIEKIRGAEPSSSGGPWTISVLLLAVAAAAVVVAVRDRRRAAQSRAP